MIISQSVFLLSIVLVTLAYMLQLLKIIKNKSSNGVSLNSYIVGSVAMAITLLNSEAQFVSIVSLVGLSFSTLVAFAVYIFKTSKSTENIKEFIISFFFALFMVFGVAQAIKSFKNKSGYSDVSSFSYLIWTIYSISIIYLAENIYIIFSASISLSLYFYILVKSSIVIQR